MTRETKIMTSLMQGIDELFVAYLKSWTKGVLCAARRTNDDAMWPQIIVTTTHCREVAQLGAADAEIYVAIMTDAYREEPFKHDELVALVYERILDLHRLCSVYRESGRSICHGNVMLHGVAIEDCEKGSQAWESENNAIATRLTLVAGAALLPSCGNEFPPELLGSRG